MKTMKRSFRPVITILAAVILIHYGCRKDENGNNDDPKPDYPETLSDIDGNVYKTVEIGGQLWMAENLKVTHYSNGDFIQKVSTKAVANSSGVFAIYPSHAFLGIGSDDEMVAAYGLLYNWYAASDQRGLCPEGWRVPRDLDWQNLLNHFVDNLEDVTLDNVGDALKSCRQIYSPLGGECDVDVDSHPQWFSNDLHFGKDALGFGALPAGIRTIDGVFSGLGAHAVFWSAIGTSQTVPGRLILYDQGDVQKGNFFKEVAISVRCVWEGE